MKKGREKDKSWKSRNVQQIQSWWVSLLLYCIKSKYFWSIQYACLWSQHSPFPRVWTRILKFVFITPLCLWIYCKCTYPLTAHCSVFHIFERCIWPQTACVLLWLTFVIVQPYLWDLSMLTCAALVHLFSRLNFNPFLDHITIFVVMLHYWTSWPFPLLLPTLSWTCSSWVYT